MLDKEKLPHEVLNAKQHAREAEIVAQAGPAEDDHHRHQHGRPRHRHRARRQRRERRSELREDDDRSTPDEKQRRSRSCATNGRRCTTQVVGRGRPAHHRHRAPRVAAHRQPAARPLRPPGRPGLVALLPVARRSAAAHLRAASACARIMQRLKMPEGEAIEDPHRHPLDREARSARSRRATSTSASSCSSTTTSPTTSAR